MVAVAGADAFVVFGVFMSIVQSLVSILRRAAGVALVV